MSQRISSNGAEARITRKSRDFVSATEQEHIKALIQSNDQLRAALTLAGKAIGQAPEHAGDDV